MHRLVDDLGDLGPRLRADRLDRLAALAQHDLALALALHEDRLLDAHRAVAQLLPAVRFHRRAIGQLLVQAVEQLLAGDLGGETAQRRVGNLVFRIVPRPFRRLRGEPGLHLADAVAGERRHHEGGGEWRPPIGLLGERQQLGLLHQIDLVEDQELARRDVAEPAEDRVGLLVDAALGVDQQRHDVGVMRPAPGRRHHGAVEPAARRENARRVDEDELRTALHGDAAHQRARRLHLRADDRHLAADQRVDQRRLADIGRPDQGDESAAGGRVALFSGWGRLSHRVPPPRRPRASAGPPPPPARRRAWSGRRLRPA